MKEKLELMDFEKMHDLIIAAAEYAVNEFYYDLRNFNKVTWYNRGKLCAYSNMLECAYLSNALTDKDMKLWKEINFITDTYKYQYCLKYGYDLREI